MPFFRREAGLLIREAPRDRVPTAVFEGDVPSEADRQRILASGFGLHLVSVPRDHADLRFLEGFQGLEFLGVVGVGLDTRRLAGLRSLVELRLNVVDAPRTDLSNLSGLTTFTGLLSSFESVFDAPALSTLDVQETSRGSLPSIPRHLTTLSLAGARKVVSLEARDSPSELRSFSIEGARSFDLSSLHAFSSLRELVLERVGSLVTASALGEMNLAGLGILNCRSIDDVDALAAVANCRVTVVGSLGKVVRPAVPSASTSTWTFLGRGI